MTLTNPTVRDSFFPEVFGSGQDSVSYSAGHPAFFGRTTVEVRGDASVDVKFEQGNNADSYPLTLAPAELDQLQKLLRDCDLASLPSARTTGVLPDDVPVRIALTAGGNRLEGEFWQSEQWGNPKLRALVAAFSQLAIRASGGKVAY